MDKNIYLIVLNFNEKGAIHNEFMFTKAFAKDEATRTAQKYLSNIYGPDTKMTAKNRYENPNNNKKVTFRIYENNKIDEDMLNYLNISKLII